MPMAISTRSRPTGAGTSSTRRNGKAQGGEASSAPRTKRVIYLASWILSGDGWIELGQDDFSRSLVRILDTGGLIWESDAHYDTVAEALAAAERALAQWIEENLPLQGG